MKNITLTSREAMLATVAEVVRLKLNHASATAAMETEIAAVQKRFAVELDGLGKKIGAHEASVAKYCGAHRAELFPDKKSLDLPCAEIGFEITPPRVETANKKITWKDVVARALKLAWGRVYVRVPEPKPDKDALLTDREKLSAEQQTALGIQFCQDEQFFIRPKSAIVEETVAAV